MDFDPEPLGAASLAQVHRATLRDGSVVAVKVQHVHVKEHTFVDMKTMEVGNRWERGSDTFSYGGSLCSYCVSKQ